MARPAPSKTPEVLLLRKTETRELEASGGSPVKLTPEKALGEMYLEDNETGAGVVSYLDSGYDYAAPPAAATPLYNSGGMGYYSAPVDAHGTGSDASLHSLGSVPTSPLVFMPSSPQLSPFIHHSQQPCQQVPFYLESASTPVFRSNTGSKTHTMREQYGSASDRQPTMGTLETTKETRYCAVCSDYASGYHYGVWSCEGCKAFFKRSIQGHNDYICPATNQCTIDRNRRKSCQACRLRKCYEVGMMKGGLRKDRGGRHLLRERQKEAEQREKSCSELVAPPLHPPLQVGGGGARRGVGVPVDQVLPLLLNAEPPSICSKQKHSGPYTEVSMMTLLTNLADKELVHMIAWAKKVPGFQELSLHDQVQLLESSWLEVLIIGLVWRSIHCPGKLLFAQDLILDRSEGSCVEGMAEIFDMILATVSRFRALKLKSEEFVCLKAIILLNSGAFPFCSSSVEPLNDSPTVQSMLDTITDALIHYIAKSGLAAQQQSRRQAQLLLLLSHIRHMSNKGMEHLYSMKCKNMVPLYDLLLELLDAHRLHSPAKAEQAKVQAEVSACTPFCVQSSLNVES
ncbi:estrogen receptor [Megalops cyprinoides]|uniref:estrogen receptor n=1 Tax=Megalops cyprinoides TaxID=118141 RepID=UPI001863B470|nr:estrogen receptor [Megalops cyprinoides]